MAWGQMTATIYGLIRDAKHGDAIRILEDQLRWFPDSQAALSLLGYCHYVIGDFHAAAAMYHKLIKLCPENEDYNMYYAQSLYKAGMLSDAAKACLAIENQQEQVLSLQACIRYEDGDIAGSRVIIEKMCHEDMDAMINLGCCLYKEGNYQDSYHKFTDAMNAVGFQPELAYNRAVCLYQLKHFAAAIKLITEIFDFGVTQYPELSVGSHMERVELCSVGNCQTLKESALIEAFNLKASIEYASENTAAAKEALDDMPPRSEEELDSVTLHNQALINMDTDPTSGFCKLNFLIQNPPFPQEAFGNLLLLYCKSSYGFYDFAADLMAEHANDVFKYISQDLHDIISAIMLAQSSVEDAYEKFSELATRHSESMRRLTKQIQENCISRDQDAHKRTITEYDDALENYLPVVMAMAKIFWDREDYAQVERIFLQSADFCSEHPTWKLNVAHTFFMQDNRYKEAIHYYEPIVKKAGDDMLKVPAIVIANLCVSYIMTSQNEEAEDMMRKIEKEEERSHYENPNKQELHLCIVNLVIGTLYCAKQNFEFGISRIIRSLEPYGKKLETDTWFYAKRCFLALIDNLAKQMILLKDSTFADIDEFLDGAEAHGKQILTQSTSFASVNDKVTPIHERGTPTISQESRLLKRMFLKLRE